MSHAAGNVRGAMAAAAAFNQTGPSQQAAKAHRPTRLEALGAGLKHGFAEFIKALGEPGGRAVIFTVVTWIATFTAVFILVRRWGLRAFHKAATRSPDAASRMWTFRFPRWGGYAPLGGSAATMLSRGAWRLIPQVACAAGFISATTAAVIVFNLLALLTRRA